MDRLDALAGRGLRAALVLVRGSRSPMTAADAAAALGIHPTVARGRLERLLRAGLLEATFARRSGRSGPGAGRPAKLYSPMPELAALELPPRRFPALVGRILDEMPENGREQALRRAGEQFGDDLANAVGLRPSRDREEGFERVCAAVRSLGFQASLEQVDGDTAVIKTPTCPLRPLLAERLEAAHVDRGMWAGLVARGLSGVRAESVECETSSCLERHETCSVVIRLSRQVTAAPGAG